MAAAEKQIRIVKERAPMSEEAARRKSEFDGHMHPIRHYAKYADREAAEYIFRQLGEQVKLLSQRYGFRLDPKVLRLEHE